MPGAIHRTLGTKLALAVGLPSLAGALAGVLWLQLEADRHAGAAMESTFRVALGGLLLFAAVMVAIHVTAMRLLVQRPIARLAAGLERARQGDFLHRVPVESQDELGQLALSFNKTLAAITDLHALRIDDHQSMESMRRELALKVELEMRVRELSLLHDLGGHLSATLDLDQLARDLTAHVGRGLGEHAFAFLLAEESTGDLVVRGVSGLDAAVEGTRIPAGEGPAGWAVRERATLLVKDTAVDPRRPILPWLQAAHGSILAIPLLHQDGCTGALAFYRPLPGAFPPEEVRFLEAVAAQAAIAVENARLHQQMVRLSQSDALTGVHNRRSLFARLEMESERCTRFDHAMSVALVDVDSFRELNDARGHAAGDEVLRQVAALLGASVRKVDLVARYGGEEFAVVLPRADRAAALAAAEKLREAIAGARIPHPAAARGHVTVSIGVASWPDDATEPGALIDCADAALFAAKRAGRDVVRAHEPGMRGHPSRRRDQQVTASAELPRATAT